MTTSHTSFKRLVLAGLLATIGIAASAQTAPPAHTTAAAVDRPAHRMMHRHDPAEMQEFMAKRQAALKAKLQITPAQEPAWTAFTASMQPPARSGERPDRAAFDKLTTPERIDRMRAMRSERDARMDQRGDATKTFYAALTPEQQTVFDANTMRGGPGGHHPHGSGGHPHKG